MVGAQIVRSQGRELAANPGFVLAIDAAKAWDRSIAEYGKGVLLTGAWRSYETQLEIFLIRYRRGNRAGDPGFSNDVRWWPADGNYWTRLSQYAAAAVPGTSNHGSGRAVDVKTRRDAADPPYPQSVIWSSWTDTDRADFLRVAAKNGWDDDEGRSVNEVWHLTWYAERDQHRGQSAPVIQNPTEVDGMTPEEHEMLEKALWNAREAKADIDTLVSLLVPTIKDGTGAAPLPDILERTLAGVRANKVTLAEIKAKTDTL